MTQREKMMAGVVGAAAGIYFGYVAIQKLILEPNQQLIKNIQNEQEYRQKLELRLNGAAKTIENWYAETGRTLSGDYRDAHSAFREDVNVLLKRNHLNEDLSLTKYKERLDKKWPREGFVELPVSVRVKGTLQELDNFLKDFFQRPYMVRVEKLDITADQAVAARAKRDKKSGKGGKRGNTVDEQKMSISLMVSTLVLPKMDDREHPTFDLARLNDPEAADSVQVAFADRLRHDPEAYNEIVAKNPFKLWTPPPPTPPRNPPQEIKTQEVVDSRPKPEPPPVRPNPRPHADKMLVEGVARLDDGPIVYVADTSAASQPPAEYRLNDQVDDGKLILIVPEGIVVRVKEKSGRQNTTKNYYYPLGSTFRERVEVDPVEHPTIARYLEVVLSGSES